MLPRVLEAEAMGSLDEALDYDAMDHAEVNRLFVADLLAATQPGDCPDFPTGKMGLSPPPTQPRPVPRTILDLGTGTAQIPIELCRQDGQARVVAVDAAHEMLKVARRNVEAAGLADHISVERVDAKRLPYPGAAFASVISNSIVHHVPEPRDVLAQAWRVLRPGGLVFFRDLFRPADDEAVRHLVDTYAAGANQHQRQMFEDSLRAALTVDEARALVAELGLSGDTVQATSDRHWTWSARK